MELHHQTAAPRKLVAIIVRSVLNRIIEGDLERGIAPAPEAGPVMGIAAFLAPDCIPQQLLHSTNLPSAGVEDVLAALAEVSLVTLCATPRGRPAFSTHRLVQLVAQDMMREEKSAADLLEAGLAVVDAGLPHATWEYLNREQCDELATHGAALLEHAATEGVETATVSRLSRKLGNLLETRAQYDKAATLFERSMTISDAVHGAESVEAGAILHDLGMLRQAQGRYSEAEPLLKRSLAIKEKTVGGEHPSTSATLHDLARLYQAQGRYSEAEPLLKRSLAIKEKTVGGEHPDTGITLRAMAELFTDVGNIAEARSALKRAWRVLQPHWGDAHVRWAQILNVAALVDLAEGAIADAETAARAALTRRLSMLPADHPEVAQSKWTLARVMIAGGRAAEAEPLLREAIAALERKVTPEHVWLKGARATLAFMERHSSAPMTPSSNGSGSQAPLVDPVASLSPPASVGAMDSPRRPRESWWKRLMTGRRKR